MTTGTEQEKDITKTALDIALELIEAENNHDVGALIELHSTDYKWHQPDGRVITRDELRNMAQGLFFAYPDRRQTVHDSMQDGDKAILRWTSVSHALSDGAEYKQSAIEIFRVVDEKIVEVWSVVANPE
jgi:predicted SnoaL-like aldol condensation-catalyzing enzyme